MEDIKVQLLSSDKDKDLLIDAYRWRETSPSWFQECLEIWKESLEDYLESSVNELHYGVWHEGQFIAAIRLVPDQMDFVYNLHLNVKKGTDPEVLYVASCTLRDFLFSQGRIYIYGYLPTFNRGISKLYECLGFTDTGIRIFKGMVRGKLVEWKHYAIVH